MDSGTFVGLLIAFTLGSVVTIAIVHLLTMKRGRYTGEVRQLNEKERRTDA
jgi:hypothetical protein